MELFRSGAVERDDPGSILIPHREEIAALGIERDRSHEKPLRKLHGVQVARAASGKRPEAETPIVPTRREPIAVRAERQRARDVLVAVHDEGEGPIERPERKSRQPGRRGHDPVSIGVKVPVGEVPGSAPPEREWPGRLPCAQVPEA